MAEALEDGAASNVPNLIDEDDGILFNNALERPVDQDQPPEASISNIFARSSLLEADEDVPLLLEVPRPLLAGTNTTTSSVKSGVTSDGDCSVFVQNDLATLSLPVMEDIRRHGKLCDVTIKVRIQ